MASRKPFALVELRGDLFGVDSSFSLAHAVAADFRLGKGIAVLFRDKFGGLDVLRSSGAKVGEVVALKRGSPCRFIYNLVTKERSSGSYPTLTSMRSALVSLRAALVSDGVSQLAMPRIGCGLDKLLWENVRALILEVFETVHGLTITVFTL